MLPAEDRHLTWQRATVHLATHVVDRTTAGDAWFSHCEQVLTWFPTRWGVPAEKARDPARAQRLLAALGQVHVDAAAGQSLNFALLCGWQRLVLDTPHAPFRTGPAFAKAGREHYSAKARTSASSMFPSSRAVSKRP